MKTNHLIYGDPPKEPEDPRPPYPEPVPPPPPYK